MKRTIGLVFVFVLLPLTILFGANYTSHQSGSWYAPSTWGTTTIPGINDNVTIRNSHIIQMDGATEVSINNLTITGGTEGQSVLLGANGMLTTLIVHNSVHLIQSLGLGTGGRLQAGTDGNLDVQIGGDLQVHNNSEYYVHRTTFTALGDGIVNNTCIFWNSPSAVLSSIFDTANSNVIIQVQTSVTFPESNWGRFEYAKVEQWATANFTNCAFSNCELTTTSPVNHNTYNNCHFTATTVAETAYFTGPVAVLDNSSMFNNVTIEGGSLWGNINTASQTTITGNLVVTSGTISWGEGGTLDIFLGGNIEVAQYYNDYTIVYNVSNTYFSGNRPANNPQLIGIGAVIDGNFVNQWSYIKLTSDLTFRYSTPLHTFSVGYLDIYAHRIYSAHLTAGYINSAFTDGGELMGCQVSSVIFNCNPEFSNVTLMDSNVLFNAGLTIWWGMDSAAGQSIQTTIHGFFNVRNKVTAGEYGTLEIFLDGDCSLSDTLNISNLTFISNETKYLNLNGSYFIHCNITNNGSTIILSPSIDLDDLAIPVYLNGHVLSGDEDSGFILYRPAMISDGFFSNCRIANAETPHAGVTLNNMSMYNCDFNLPVAFTGICVLNDSQTEFQNGLTVHTTLRGAIGNNISFTTTNLIVDGGVVEPGEGGTLEVYISGDLNVNSNYSGASFSPTHTRFNGTATQNIYIPYAIFNSTVTMMGPQSLSLQSSLSFSSDQSKAINSYNNGQNNFLLNGYGISNVNLGGGNYYNGGLYSCNLYYLNCSDINLWGNNNLGNNDNVFSEQTTNFGTINGYPGYASTFTVNGNFTQNGVVLPGAGGTIDAYLYGNVALGGDPLGAWGGTIHLRGSADRNLNIPADVSVLIDNLTMFSLVGVNTLPSIVITEGSSLTVPAGATLSFTNVGDYYTGNLILNGTITNSRLPLQMGLAFHQMNIMPNSDYSAAVSLDGTHAMIAPGNIPSNTGEYWSILPETAVPEMSANMDFYYQGTYNSKNALYFSTDTGMTWQKFAGTYYQNAETRMLSALGVPLGALYAISSVVDTWRVAAPISPDTTNTVLMPTFTWNAFPGATAYSLEIANDPDMLDIIYQTPDSSAISHHTLIPLAPNSVFYWRVNCVSSLGTFTSVQASFSTRQALGCSLPEAVVIMPDNYSSFYMPVFLSGILAEESYNVIPTPSAHIFGDFVDGQLTMTPDPGWFGVETVNLEIYDCYTTINTSIEITVLGTPHDINIACVGNETFLDWPNIPGSTYCKVYYCETTDGTWNYLGWTSSNSYVHPQTGVKGFYRITACTGELPEQASIK